MRVEQEQEGLSMYVDSDDVNKKGRPGHTFNPDTLLDSCVMGREMTTHP